MEFGVNYSSNLVWFRVNDIRMEVVLGKNCFSMQN